LVGDYVARYVDTDLVLALGTSLWLGGCRLSERKEDGKQGYMAAEYSLGGRPVKLSGGVSEIQAAPGSAAKISTRYFGNEVTHDLNGDGRPDVVFLLTQETGGTGVFYYVVAALNTPHGFVGSEGLLLGDRIAPQTIEIGTNELVIVNYADRAPGESFAMPPSVGKSLASAGHDPRPIRARRRKHTVVAGQVRAGLWHQRSKSGHQVLRLEDHVRRAVPIRCLQCTAHARPPSVSDSRSVATGGLAT
jgi:hypothetical protein